MVCQDRARTWVEIPLQLGWQGWTASLRLVFGPIAHTLGHDFCPLLAKHALATKLVRSNPKDDSDQQDTHEPWQPRTLFGTGFGDNQWVLSHDCCGLRIGLLSLGVCGVNLELPLGARGLIRHPAFPLVVSPGRNEVQRVGQTITITAGCLQSEHLVGQGHGLSPGRVLVDHSVLRDHEGDKATLGAEGVPAVFLEAREAPLDPIGVEHEVHNRRDGQELDPMDEEPVGTEVGLELHDQVVNDPHHGVMELLRVDVDVLGDVPVKVGADGLHLHHGLPRQGDQRLVGGFAVEVDPVPGVDGLAGRLLPLSVRVRVDAEGPRVPHEEVEVPEGGEVLVFRTWVGNVPDQGKHLLVVLLGPGLVELGDDGGGVDEVPVVEVVVVVVGVAEIEVGVRQRGALQLGRVVAADWIPVRLRPIPPLDPDVLAAAGDHPAPGLVVDQEVLGGVVQPAGDVSSHAVQHLVPGIGFRQLIRNEDQATHLGQELTHVVGVDHAVLHVVTDVVVLIRGLVPAHQRPTDGLQLLLVWLSDPGDIVAGVEQRPRVARKLQAEGQPP
mmetsp:Transcript_110520/g.191530  ORF Transcript_110520/g.191530 Transcript_110520/m.191530 type:complete len:553 (-) Transcript_110520:1412-3070(-)